MIALDPTRSQDDICCFIGTTAAILGLIGAGIGAGASVYSANKSASTAENAANLNANASQQQIDFEKSQAAQDQANWEAAMQFNVGQYNAKVARLQPFVNAGGAATSTLNSMIYGNNPPAALSAQAPVASVPAPAGPYATGAPAPTTAAPATATPGLPSTTTTPTATTTPPPNVTAQNFGDLTNPQAWMSLVGNQQNLTSWVKAQNPGLSDGLVNYYVGKIQGQPGADPTEQAGSANYWSQKIKADPTTATASAGGAAAPGATGGTTLNTMMTPASFAAQAAPVPVSLTASMPTSTLTMPTPQQVAPLTLNNLMVRRPTAPTVATM